MTHPRLRQLAALTTTLALLAGLPWLATLLTWPVLDLSWTSVQVHLRSARLPQGVGTALLILALWGLWSLYLAVVITEAIGRFRHRQPRLRLLRPLQMLAATTLGTIAVSPAAAHAAAPATTISQDPAEPVAEDLAGIEADRQDVEEPVLIDRSRTIDSFGYDSAELSEPMRQDVQVIAQLIDQHGSSEIPVVVTGHTDAAGDAAYNLDLSQRRAEAVAEQLRTHLGEGITVRAEGEGDRALIDSADDAEQRRVEISYSVLLTPPPAPDTPPAHHDPENEDAPEETSTPAVGLSLPGGLILAMTTGTAGVVAGMALERRRGQPQHSSDAYEASTDAHDQAEAAHHTAEAPLSPSAPIDTDEDAEDERPELAMIDLARAPGLGITGPGAEGAARTLLTRALDHSESALTVVVPNSDLHALLDETRRLPQLDEDASIMVTDGVEDALTLLQLQVLARHRAADEHDDTEDQDAAPPGGPQFVLLARADAGVATEVASLLAHTPNAPLHAILLGPWPQDDGPTMSIDAHGVITTADAPFAEAVGHHWATTTSAELYRALLTRHDTPFEDTEDTEHADVVDGIEEPELEPEPGAEAAAPRQAEASAGAVSVTVLGRITLAVHGQQVRPHRRAAYEVLSYLAAHPAGVRLEAAVDAMWPQDTGHRAIRRWHDACTSVRTACRPLLGEDATAVIIHDGDLYRLNPDLVVCDLWRVEQFLDEADHSGTPAELASSAAAMCDGDFASESDYLWAHGPRTRLRTRLVTALVRTAQNEEPVQAQSLLHRAVEIDPSDVDAAHDLIKLCLDRGDERTARRIYHRHKLAVEDLDNQPDGTITRLLGGVEIS
ncbi:OmpA family protein [Nocardiopsis sp. HUAS JQ3]|uniref:OmpA family protein n=1 Tax=Nocardiopsis sp. HUAS JQ3 TaxID=3061629 RepID=UPI0023A9A78C|nr:OmpA family protein [Nocardiopsis sp. HUAS JQ3]WDZ92835.1 OmpA family protein [Nocardiopsis sp. HUAS JQ3]